MTEYANDPAAWQALFIAAVALAVVVLIYQNRQKIAGINTPFIDTIIGKSIYWLVGLVIVTTIATATLSVFGITAPIRVLSAESLCYLAGAYALVKWAQAR